MLDPQIVVNLLLELGVSVDLVIHGDCLVKDLSVARDGADQGLGGIVDGRWCSECAARPSEGIPNGGTQVLAVCAAPGELDYFATLALQQHGEQSALRNGRRHNFLFSLSKRWTIFAGIPFIPSGRFAKARE
jgi:hypothetical protein